MTNLALAYLDGQGVIRDIEAAITWLENSSSREEPRADYHLGKMYASGTHLKKRK